MKLAIKQITKQKKDLDMLTIISDAMMTATGNRGQNPDHREAEMRRRYLAQQQQKFDGQRFREIARINGHW